MENPGLGWDFFSKQIHDPQPAQPLTDPMGMLGHSRFCCSLLPSLERDDPVGCDIWGYVTLAGLILRVSWGWEDVNPQILIPQGIISHFSTRKILLLSGCSGTFAFGIFPSSLQQDETYP